MSNIVLYLPGYFSALLNKNRSSFIFIFDGCNCFNYNSFHNEVRTIFQLPDYYGRNTHALEECINDLDWIDAASYTLIIRNYDSSFSKEESISIEQRYEAKKIYLDIFCQAKHDWANVPNHPGEDEYREKKAFDVYVEKSDEVVKMLRELGVSWEMYQESKS